MSVSFLGVGEREGEITHELEEFLLLPFELSYFAPRWFTFYFLPEPSIDGFLANAVILCRVRNTHTIVFDAVNDLLFDLFGDLVSLCHIPISLAYNAQNGCPTFGVPFSDLLHEL